MLAGVAPSRTTRAARAAPYHATPRRDGRARRTPRGSSAAGSRPSRSVSPARRRRPASSSSDSSTHPAVETVRYPGLLVPHLLRRADARRRGAGRAAVRSIENATSLGGTRTKLEARHRWEGDRIPTGLLRLSVGLEDPEDVWADLAQSLARPDERRTSRATVEHDPFLAQDGRDADRRDRAARPRRPIAVVARHLVLDTPIVPPFPEGLERIVVGMGCFWGAERLFWQAPGVYTTAVGYAGGFTPNPTYEEVCSGRTGHTEVVLAVFDPAKTSYEEMLRIFWEGHDPTQGMRQGNDVGTQYRSAIYWHDQRQLDRGRHARHVPGRADAAPATRDDHDRDRRGGAVLLRRGVPPAVPRREPERLLRARRDGRRLPGPALGSRLRDTGRTAPDGLRLRVDDRHRAALRGARSPRPAPPRASARCRPG